MKPWQASLTVCNQCENKWAAVHPAVCEYLECPACHHMNPAPYIEEAMTQEEISELESMNAALAEWKRQPKLTVVDYKPSPVDCIKANWCVYEVTVRMPDGSEKHGTMQGDTHMWAYETFEEEAQ
jgi:hypothetical protein